MSKENKDVVRRVEEAWDSGALDALDDLFASNFVSHSPVPGAPPGLESAKMAHQGAMASFPDRKVTIEDLVAEGEDVVVRTRVTGTHTGEPFIGIPAAKKPFDISSISRYRVSGGKIAEHWGWNDAPTLMAQLGAMPGI